MLKNWAFYFFNVNLEFVYCFQFAIYSKMSANFYFYFPNLLYIYAFNSIFMSLSPTTKSRDWQATLLTTRNIIKHCVYCSFF